MSQVVTPHFTFLADLSEMQRLVAIFDSAQNDKTRCSADTPSERGECSNSSMDSQVVTPDCTIIKN